MPPVLPPRVDCPRGCAFDAVDALDDHAVGVGQHGQDFALETTVFAADDLNLVACANGGRHHNTSGASEMIFMNFLSRSSRPTDRRCACPGFPSALSTTAAFSSKRM